MVYKYETVLRTCLFKIVSINQILTSQPNVDYLQCGRSSPSQRWGADLRAHCSVKFPMTLKMGLERSQLFPEIFEIVLRPFWWAAGSEQPSPPLHRAAAARLLKRSAAAHTIMFCVRISLLQAHHISQFFCKSYFCWTEGYDINSNAFNQHIHCDCHCPCTHFSSVFVKVVNRIS